MIRCLLFNPPSALSVYRSSRVRAAIPILPSLSLAMIAGALIEEGCSVRVCDLALAPFEHFPENVRTQLQAFKPDMVGVTATTPLFYEAARISALTKEFSNGILTVLGGPHASALPAESLRESTFDYAVIGEGEALIRRLVRSPAARDIPGVVHRETAGQSGAIPSTQELAIDQLPFPALHLFPAQRYRCPKMIARRNPVGPVEMSRGCVFNCNFCNKNIFGRHFRVKSPGRVVEELRILKKLGYREFHVLDDQFSTDIERAKEICREIIRSDIGMTWNLRTGLRVDKVDREFLELAKRAGCYQVGVGFESGSQICLDEVDKKIQLEQSLRAAALIREAGIELVGFFMFGFMKETPESMEETIRFAIRLDPDYAKATILVPFPGTPIYNELEAKGLIKTRDWSRYNFHNANEIYTHPGLSWEVLNRAYELFHRRFYLRPHYLIRQLYKSLRKGSFLDDVGAGMQTFLHGRS